MATKKRVIECPSTFIAGVGRLVSRTMRLSRLSLKSFGTVGVIFVLALCLIGPSVGNTFITASESNIAKRRLDYDGRRYVFPPANSASGNLVREQSSASRLLLVLTKPDLRVSWNQTTFRSQELSEALAERDGGLEVHVREVVPLAFSTQALPTDVVYILLSPDGYVPVVVVADSDVLVTALQPDRSTAIYHRTVFLQEWTGVLLELADNGEGGA